ncbi:MAG: hypothetical protein ACLGIF_11200 [Actinomycetes bacterium]
MTDRSTLYRADNPNLDAPLDPDKDKTERKLDLSLTQVAGGALAAMTAAALGSRLGVGGTIAGAAFASIVAAVAGALYTASLRTTSERVRTVWGTAPQRRQEVRVAPTPAGPASRPLTIAWRKVLAAAIAVFALAAIFVTGFEALTGHAMSGGGGTTVTQVSTGDWSDSRPNEQRDQDREEAPPSTAEPTEEASPEATPSSEPSAATPEPTAEPSAPTPSVAVPTPAPSTPAAEPRASATPGLVAGQ